MTGPLGENLCIYAHIYTGDDKKLSQLHGDFKKGHEIRTPSFFPISISWSIIRVQGGTLLTDRQDVLPADFQCQNLKGRWVSSLVGLACLKKYALIPEKKPKAFFAKTTPEKKIKSI